MEATISIPDPVYRELESRAVIEGKAIEDVILRCVAVTLGSMKTEQTQRRQNRRSLGAGAHP